MWAPRVGVRGAAPSGGAAPYVYLILHIFGGVTGITAGGGTRFKDKLIAFFFFPHVHYALLHLFFFPFLFYDPEPVGTSNKAPPLKHNVSWHRANKPHSIVKFAIFVDAPGSGDVLHSLLITSMSDIFTQHPQVFSGAKRRHGALWALYDVSYTPLSARCDCGCSTNSHHRT